MRIRLSIPAPMPAFCNTGMMVDPVTHAAGFLTDDGWKSRKGVDKIKSDRDLDISTVKHKKAQSHWLDASEAQNIKKWVQKAGGSFVDGLIE